MACPLMRRDGCHLPSVCSPFPGLCLILTAEGRHPLSASPVSSKAGNQPEWGLDPRSPGRSLPDPRLRFAATPPAPSTPACAYFIYLS